MQSATATSFTYSLASGLNLAAATGTITAGLNDVWISLGTYAASGTLSVELTRTTAAKPSEWTIAGGMELVSSQQTIVLGTPTFGNTNAVPTPPATLAPGQYAVIVSNYVAFEERYNPTGNSDILVLGVYSGHLANSGNTVDIYQIGSRAGGDVMALNGYVPFYRVDHVSYSNVAPWPTEPDGDGPALIRINTADYGNDASNWEASNSGGTPGQANLAIDTSSPTVPINLAGQAFLSPSRGDQPHLDRLHRCGELRGLLRDLSRRQLHRHVGHDFLCGYDHRDRNELHLYRGGRQPRRIPELPVREHQPRPAGGNLQHRAHLDADRDLLQRAADGKHGHDPSQLRRNRA